MKILYLKTLKGWKILDRKIGTSFLITLPSVQLVYFQLLTSAHSVAVSIDPRQVTSERFLLLKIFFRVPRMVLNARVLIGRVITISLNS